MNDTESKPDALRRIGPFSVPALWTLLLLVIGIVQFSQAWGKPSLVVGGVSAIVLVVAIVLRSWIGAVYGVLLVTALGSVAAGFAMGGDMAAIAVGVLSVMIIGASLPITLLLRARAAPPAAAPAVADGGMVELLRQIQQHSMLSDNAKRVLFRERELNMLRHAIESDLGAGKYDVGLTLCDEMADVFGFREEAEAYRERILQARQEHYDTEVWAALEHFEKLLADRDWPAVHQEAARIKRLFGDSHLVQDLDNRILLVRDDHKRELEGRFLEAAKRDDVEGAMALLKELDRYLGPEEAERLAEVAQGVVAGHRENLGVQFKLAVNDHRWAEAARTGEAIIEEFPNTKMADEVRSMIDLLRTRATQAAVAGERA